jgi:hypothetical protein
MSTHEDGEVKTPDQPVKIAVPPAGAVVVDPQNPLPEASFFWRRTITMIVSLVLLGIAWHNAIQLHDLGVSADLLRFAQWCIALNGFVLLCYFVGPSAAELTAMIQSARIIKSGIRAAGEAQDTSESARNRGQERDSALPPSGDSGEAPYEAPRPAYEDDEEDAAPKGRR